MYTHKVVIGDWSHDGHGFKETFNFICNHSANDILKAYKAAYIKNKIAVHSGSRQESGITTLCADYEEGTIAAHNLERLKAMGIDIENLFLETVEDGGWDDGQQPVYPEDMANLFFAFAKTELPDLTYKMVKESQPINQNLGFIGYGCFST